MAGNNFVVFLFALCLTSCGLSLAEPHSLKYDDKAFNEISNSILDQQSIYEMDDLTRYYKSINGVPVKLDNVRSDENAQYLRVVEDSLRLDPGLVSELRLKLEKSKLREFTKSGDTILFIVDGFLNDSWGFMYARRGLTMDSTWFGFKENSVKFVENINQNWKRTAIQ
jgi:hypothetical protein